MKTKKNLKKRGPARHGRPDVNTLITAQNQSHDDFVATWSPLLDDQRERFLADLLELETLTASAALAKAIGRVKGR